MEYEASLKVSPARLNSYLGAAQAAKRAGQADKAKMYKDRLLTMCGGSVPDRVADAVGK